MKKDLFIDNNVAKNFTNPMDPEYKELIAWLLKNSGDKSKSAFLVVSNKLLQEYFSSNRGANKGTNIAVIINVLTKQGRLVKVTNQEIKSFQQRYFTNKIVRKLRSNRKDWEHIPVVLLSDRKYALTLDKNFRYDLTEFPGFTVVAASKPGEIPYM